MTFMDPNNREQPISVYVIAPNSDYLEEDYKDKEIVEAGPRLTEVLQHLLYRIESYPFSWDFSGKKIVSYGYDFETDLSGTSMSYIDLTEIAHKEVNEYYNFFSPLETGVVGEEEKVNGKGIMAKLKITLNQPKNVNHLTIDYFTEYPIELLSLIYQSEQNGPLYELPLSKAVQTTHSLVLHFPSVFAKIFYLIIKQETYTLSSQYLTEKNLNNAQDWDQATEASKTNYSNAVDDYFEQLRQPTKSAIKLHQEILDSYQNIIKPITLPVEGELNSYTGPFDAINKKLDSEQR